MTATVPIAPLNPTGEITTVDQLSAHLRAAAQIELCTLPLYLYAAYSIRTRGYSQWSPPLGVLRTIIGIAIEEMLHLALARNLHLAIRNTPNPPIADIRFYDKDFVPTFPGELPHCHPGLELHLRKLSQRQVHSFVLVEAPEELPHDFQPHLHIQAVGDGFEYNSIGALYRAILNGFQTLDAQSKIDWSKADTTRQYERAYWNQYGGGRPLLISNLDTAREAITVIVDQGEGSSLDHQWTPSRPDDPKPGFDEYSHFWKFMRIANGVEGIGVGDGTQTYDFGIDDPRATWPLVDDPKVENFNLHPDIHALMRLFNAAYCYLLCLLDKLFESSTTEMEEVTVQVGQQVRTETFSYRYGLERYGITAMQGVLYPIAQLLVTVPIPGAANQHAGPSFEYFDFGTGNKKQRLIELCTTAMSHFPQLGGEDSVRSRIDILVDIDEDPETWVTNKINRWIASQNGTRLPTGSDG